MTRIDIEIHDQAVTDAFNRLQALGQDVSPVLEAIGRQLETNVKLGFDASQDPYGNPWEPLKVREGGQPLVDKGHLRDSITHAVDGNSAVVGTNLEYARLQNFGGTVKPVNAKALRFFVGNRAVIVGEVTIPPRPFFPNEAEGLPGDWTDDVVAVISNAIQGAM